MLLLKSLDQPTGFLDGKQHTDYRRSLNGLFSSKALEIYIPVQEKIHGHLFREINMMVLVNFSRNLENYCVHCR